MNLLITGASGFVGQALAGCALAAGQAVRPVLRPDAVARFRHLEACGQAVVIPDLRTDTVWSQALLGVDAVVHAAARVHVMHETADDALAAFRAVNVDATAHLARQAMQAGVRRFVFISSVKVVGESSQPGSALTELSPPRPEDAYGQSKLDAELALTELTRGSDMELVIVRPPLVYGPGVKGNFASMLAWVRKGVPLPLGAVHNQRSLLALDNLVDFVLLCADRVRSPNAAHQVFMLADGEDVSTTGLLQKVGRALQRPARLLPVPVALMRVGAALLGKRALADRLLGNLQVDTSKAHRFLGWTPPVSMDEQLASMLKQGD